MASELVAASIQFVVSVGARVTMVETTAWSVDDVFAGGPAASSDIPIYLARSDDPAALGQPDDAEKAWLAAQNFSGAAKRYVLVPGADGRISSVAFGVGDGHQGDPSGPSELLAGLLAQALPAGTYRFASELQQTAILQPWHGLSAPIPFRGTNERIRVQAAPSCGWRRRARRASSTRPRRCGSAAISSTRRRRTWDRPTSKTRRGCSPSVTAHRSPSSQATNCWRRTSR